MLTLLIIALLAYAIACISLLLWFLGRKSLFALFAKGSSLIAFTVLTMVTASFLPSFFTENQLLTREVYLFSFAWGISLVALFFWYKLKNPLLFLFASPLLFLLVHTAMLARKTEIMLMAPFQSSILFVHVFSFFTSLAFLIIASVAAILFLLQEKAMKTKQHKSFLLRHCPSLESLDKINYFSALVVFPFYTLGLVFGFVWAFSTWGAVFSADIKEIFSLLIWLLLAFLFHARLVLGYRGKKPALLLLVICALSLFSLFGINIFFETHHRF